MEKLENLDLPSYWEKKRFKNIFTFNKGLTITKENLEEEGVKCVNYGEIHSKYGFELNPEIHELKCVNESYLKNNVKSLISYGDFVFADTSEDIEGSGNFTHINSQEKIFAGYHTLICRTTKPINSKFFAYLFDSKSFRSQVQKKVKGVKVYSITQNILKDTLVWVPKDDEQTKIASFLDEKTSQIDNAISQKEKLIELLKERRQITINEAVTKGLDKNVEFKDSDVEWIGEIPKHWEVFPGLRVFSENKRKNTGMIDDRVLSLSYGRIIRKPKEKLVGLVPESFETYQIVKAGDIIIRCTDLQNDKVSLRTALAKDDGIITSAYLNLNVKNGSSEYWHYLLHVLDITKAIYKLGSGLRQNLSFNDFKRLDIVLPPKEEQIQIVEYIETQTAKIDKAIELQQNYISKLKEYKASLIDSVVTGKVRVA